MQGKKLVPQIIPEIENKHGIWYSLIAGDFDKDGDQDYIAGNLGNNNRFPVVSDKYPVNLYAIDLDLNGTIDPIMTAYWEDRHGKMTEFPVNYLDELLGQSGYFRKIFDSYASFSYTTFDQMVDKEVLKRLDFKLFINTTSSYIIWNDKGKFRWEKLADPLQVAPVKKMIVRDLNNDGWLDILLTGNDYTYDVSTGNYDANKGVVLLNNGDRKSFNLLIPSRSGFFLQGMVESLLCLDGEKPLIVAGINRSKAVVYEIQK
jgi:hypothetical protein